MIQTRPNPPSRPPVRRAGVLASIAASVALWGLVGAAASPRTLASTEPPETPAEIRVAVSPGAADPGAKVGVKVELVPIEGVAINKYPRARLQVAAQPGVVAADAEASIGADAMPPADRLDENYFDDVDPLTLDLEIDPAAASGRHTAKGKLRYFYCVKASGFCAPKRAEIEIPLEVR